MNDNVELLKDQILKQTEALNRLNFAFSCACYTLADGNTLDAGLRYHQFLELADSEYERLRQVAYLEEVYKK